MEDLSLPDKIFGFQVSMQGFSMVQLFFVCSNVTIPFTKFEINTNVSGTKFLLSESRNTYFTSRFNVKQLIPVNAFRTKQSIASEMHQYSIRAKAAPIDQPSDKKLLVDVLWENTFYYSCPQENICSLGVWLLLMHLYMFLLLQYVNLC